MSHLVLRPARVVYGTWARGRMSAHAWDEFWLDGPGWVPVDAGLGWAMRHRPWNRLGQGLPMRPEACFARLDGERIGFSYGPDVEAAPAFQPVQPAYPRFTSTPVRRQDPSGRWRVTQAGGLRRAVSLRLPWRGRTAAG